MAGYRRTVSFPAMTAAAKRSGIKIRSLSLPVRFDPIVCHMNEDVAILISWSGSFVQSPSPIWLLEGVQYISSVIDSLLRLMNHPMSEEQLRNSPTSILISEDLLRMVGSYGSFCNSLLDLAPLQADTRTALQRQDPSRVALSIRAQKQAARIIQKLASDVQRAAKARPDITRTSTLPIALCNAMMALASASAVVFVGISVLSDESAILAAPMAEGSEKPMKCIEVKWIIGTLNWKLRAQKKKAITDANREEERARARVAALDNIDKLDECIKAMEDSCEKIYKDLVNARVSLLNVLSFR
ncbi:hypothetical protein LUZ60_008811 [Juncus effusus]|nr:hypothetical protein LUZ60_008811 [Juncus effusus]